MNRPYAVLQNGLWCIFRAKPHRNEEGQIYWPLPTVKRSTLAEALRCHYKHLGWTEGLVKRLEAAQL